LTFHYVVEYSTNTVNEGHLKELSFGFSTILSPVTK